MNKKEELSLKKMDELNNIDFNININIRDIIESAEKIKRKRKEKIESLIFILLTSVILSSIIFTIMIGFSKIFIYIQFAFYTLSPFIVLFAAIIVRRNESCTQK